MADFMANLCHSVSKYRNEFFFQWHCALNRPPYRYMTTDKELLHYGNICFLRQLNIGIAHCCVAILITASIRPNNKRFDVCMVVKIFFEVKILDVGKQISC